MKKSMRLLACSTMVALLGATAIGLAQRGAGTRA